jgi:hypothetical protein
MGKPAKILGKDKVCCLQTQFTDADEPGAGSSDMGASGEIQSLSSRGAKNAARIGGGMG